MEGVEGAAAEGTGAEAAAAEGAQRLLGEGALLPLPERVGLLLEGAGAVPYWQGGPHAARILLDIR